MSKCPSRQLTDSSRPRHIPPAKLGSHLNFPATDPTRAVRLVPPNSVPPNVQVEVRARSARDSQKRRGFGVGGVGRAGETWTQKNTYREMEYRPHPDVCVRPSKMHGLVVPVVTPLVTNKRCHNRRVRVGAGVGEGWRQGG